MRVPSWKRTAYILPILLTVGLGALNIISSVSGSRRAEVVSDAVFGKAVDLDSRGLILLLGFFLLIIAEGLMRRSRWAWRLAVAICAISILGHLVRGLRLADAAVGVLTLASLLWNRLQYDRPSDRPSIGRSLLIIAGCLAAMLAFGILSFHFLGRHQFGHRFGYGESLVHLGRLYLFMNDQGLTPKTDFARLFIAMVYTIAAFGWLTLLLALVLPAIERAGRRGERAEVDRMISKFSEDSLDPFKASSDKLHFFPPDRSSMIAYVLVGTTALALGDPVGEHIGEAIRTFTEHCEARGWRVAFQQISDKYADEFRQAGYRLLKVGEQAVLRLSDLSLEGAAMKGPRAALRRMEREGCIVRQYSPPVPWPVIRQMEAVSEQWKSALSRQERAFAQSTFTPTTARGMTFATIEHPETGVIAFISLVEYASRCVALDLLRRSANIAHGAMEALVIQTALEYKDRGYLRFDLGLAPLAGLAERQGSGLPERTLRLFYDNANKVFSYRGLRAFKAKFQPAWEPRYLAYQADYQLPIIGLAVLRAAQVPRDSADD